MFVHPTGDQDGSKSSNVTTPKYVDPSFVSWIVKKLGTEGRWGKIIGGHR